VRLTNILSYFFGALSIGLCNSSCTLVKPHNSAIIAVDGTPVTTEEFLYVYNKNNLEQEPPTRKEIDEYLDLFVNFKLKVREAESLGLHRDSAFIQELEGYKKQLAAPYLTETRIIDSLVQVTYDRLKTEVNASHILITVPKDATPADTLEAYQQILALKDQIISGGKSFEQTAFEQSQDPSAKRNKGNLGYFTAMQMVYPFEEAAYKLPLDSISDPVRTDFGYHLIKVNQRRPSQGRIQVSHILVRAQSGIAAGDSTLAANRAREIYTKATNGDDWNLLCRQFSEDVGTKMKGGQLPWFKTGDISNIPSFETAAFSLEHPGDISEPVKTAYGWHILRLDGKQGLEPFEELEPKIRSNLSSSSRAHLNQTELIKRLKQENNFKENQQMVEKALEFGNEDLETGSWQISDDWDHLDQVLFTVEKSNYLVRKFYEFVEEKQPFKSTAGRLQSMESAYEQFVNSSLLDYEEDHLADKHYDYKMLLREYRDGILLFQLMEERVWNQAIMDTTGLREFFEQNQDQYQWEDRVSANIYNADTESSLEKVREFIDQGYVIFTKYDFHGTETSLNKAQVRILEGISRQLLSGEDRYLVFEYDTTSIPAARIKETISKQLDVYGIGDKQFKVRYLPVSQGFIIYAASSSVEDLLENMNKENPLTLQLESGQFQRGENRFVDQVPWVTGKHQLNADERSILVEITKLLPAGDQQLDEIKGQVISDYQNLLEAEWIDELRQKYPVEIYEKEVEKVYEQFD